MERPFSLSGRRLEVLTAVIRGYIGTGEPVGSQTLAKKRRDGLSPASIRNVMAELESQGYLTHPHTSAGRIPTEKAFRHYVQHLSASRLGRSEADFIQDNLEQAATLEERLGRSSYVLATLTGQLGLVVMAPLSQAILEHVQFARLSDRRILVVLVARGDVVRNRIIRAAEDIASDELERIANYINQNFMGWNLAAVRTEILRRLAEERAAFDAVLRRLGLLCMQGFLSGDSHSQVYLEGAPNLLGAVQSVNTARMRELLQALDEKEKLIQVLDECMRGEMRVPAGESLYVRIGLGEAHPVMKDYSLIGTVCDIEPGIAGRIAVIGPTRMQYERVMSAVSHVATVFQGLTENN